MFSKCLVVLTLFSLVAGDVAFEARRSKRTVPYHGPPAPLNHDGTVAFTQEIKQANAVHRAAHTHEYQRLQAAASLAAAHPDRTSPSTPDYSPHTDLQYNGQEDDGQYRPHLYENERYNQYSSGGRYVPAPLNSDGTVAHTPEFTAIAASLRAAHQRHLVRHRRDYRYHGPPAPLNRDGTVANTAEVQQANEVHKAAYAKQYSILQRAETLAAAHPNNGPQYYAPLLSPSNAVLSVPNGYQQPLTSYYSPPTAYRFNPEARVPAPLNPDGTAAQTSAYKTIAASHQAEYQKALQNVQSLSAPAYYPQPGFGQHYY